jgi:restriction system protein
MPRRRRKSPAEVVGSLIALLVFGWVLTEPGGDFHGTARYVGLVCLVLFIGTGAIVVAVWAAGQHRLARSGIVHIDLMDGITFERYLETLFRRLGYSVQRTRATGDFGADLIVTRHGFRTVIQAKRYHKRIGVRAVQEAVAACGLYRCGSAIVVTNSRYTEQAKRLAKANAVELWDRDRLVRAILSTQRDQRNAGRRAVTS